VFVSRQRRPTGCQSAHRTKVTGRSALPHPTGGAFVVVRATMRSASQAPHPPLSACSANKGARRDRIPVSRMKTSPTGKDIHTNVSEC